MMPEESFPPVTQKEESSPANMPERMTKLLEYLLVHEWNISSGGITMIRNLLNDLKK